MIETLANNNRQAPDGKRAYTQVLRSPVSSARRSWRSTPSSVKPIDGTGKGWPFPKGGVDAEGNAKDATGAFLDAHGAH